VYWLPSFAAAERVLGQTLRRGEVCVLMGAGNVDELGSHLAQADCASASRAPAEASQ
jgi:UDP-N-acetylmuramate-alanine ligase